MPFVSSDEIAKLEIFPGGFAALASGERMMLSFLDMADGTEIPVHSHPHEQAGVMLTGRLRLVIDEEARVLGPGDAYIVPSDVVHSGEVVEGPVRVLDVFSPPREEYLEKMA
jgi:unsaturated pyranuronate lyase